MPRDPFLIVSFVLIFLLLAIGLHVLIRQNIFSQPHPLAFLLAFVVTGGLFWVLR
jgi:hypothetical protein